MNGTRPHHITRSVTTVTRPRTTPTMTIASKRRAPTQDC
jgi:hypothetical protein